jgi:hypothetical protein
MIIFKPGNLSPRLHLLAGVAPPQAVPVMESPEFDPSEAWPELAGIAQ